MSQLNAQDYFFEWIAQHEQDDESTEEMAGGEILYKFAEDYAKLRLRKERQWFLELLPQRLGVMDKLKMVRERIDEEI